MPWVGRFLADPILLSLICRLQPPDAGESACDFQPAQARHKAVTGPLFDDAIGPLMSGLTAWSGAPVPGSLISMEGNMSTMDDSRLAALHRGEVETRNLAECLALDQSALLKTVLPDIGMAQTADSVIAVADRSRREGISRQMAQIGTALREALRNESHREPMMQKLALHPSDTVRSWAVFAVARAPDAMDLKDRLAAVRPFAADTHFGAREWAWIAARPYLAADIAYAICCLTCRTADPNANIRRFAVESIRPRGVWCEHIKELKERRAQSLDLEGDEV